MEEKRQGAPLAPRFNRLILIFTSIQFYCRFGIKVSCPRLHLFYWIGSVAGIGSCGEIVYSYAFCQNISKTVGAG